MAGSIGAGFCRGFAGKISFDKHDSEHMVEVLEEQYRRTTPEEIAGSYLVTKWCIYGLCNPTAGGFLPPSC